MTNSRSVECTVNDVIPPSCCLPRSETRIERGHGPSSGNPRYDAFNVALLITVVTAGTYGTVALAGSEEGRA